MTRWGILARLGALLRRGKPAPTASTTTSSSIPDDAGSRSARELRTEPQAGTRASEAPSLHTLQQAAGTADERRVLDACLALHAGGKAPAELLYLAAKLFEARGEFAVALGLLRGLDEPRAWLFCADVMERMGERSGAKMLWERALAKDIDAGRALDKLSRLAGGTVTPTGADHTTLLNRDISDQTLRIVGEAGRGGAATVYRAVDDGLGRQVALKVYHQPRKFRAQLLHEARTAVRLAGTGVVRVFDADPESGWVAMEWAAGGSLRQRLRAQSGHITIDTLTWFYELSATLATIHHAGFVHADVKPANVLFHADHSVILSDFGLTVRAGEQHRGASAGYVSPTRAQGAPASPEDDVYALGQVLVRLSECSVSPAGCRDEARALADLLLSPAGPKDAGEVLALSQRCS